MDFSFLENFGVKISRGSLLDMVCGSRCVKFRITVIVVRPPRLRQLYGMQQIYNLQNYESCCGCDHSCVVHNVHCVLMAEYCEVEAIMYKTMIIKSYENIIEAFVTCIARVRFFCVTILSCCHNIQWAHAL